MIMHPASSCTSAGVVHNWSQALIAGPLRKKLFIPFLFFDRYKGGQNDILKKQAGWNKSLPNLSIIYEINFLSLL